MSVKHGSFILGVIVGCLALGVALVVFVKDVPALVISVVLACAVASLLYGILGGVSAAGFDLGPLKMGGSAAVLLGSVWLLVLAPFTVAGSSTSSCEDGTYAQFGAS